MIKKYFIVFLTLNYIFTSILFSDALYENIQEVLTTNPIIQERLKNFRATQQDLNIAKSEYYPTLDLRLVASYNRAGDDNQKFLHNDVDKSQYESYESSLTFTQNLFNGFSTMHQVDYQKSKSLVAAYKYIEKANEIAFTMSEAYIKVLRTKALLETARQNVQINESIYSKVKELSDSGLTTDSEVKKIHSSLSLARSKLTVANNSALEAQYNYRRILGRMPNITEMKKPDFHIVMPSTIDDAAIFAIKNNPSLLVGQYNIKSAEALYKQNYKGYYPKLDFEVSQTYNDSFPSNNGFSTTDDRFKARLILTYNLFRGTSDSAKIQKNISKINQEIDLKKDIKRQVVEDLDLAWTFYEMTINQLKDLKEYSSYAEETMVLYKEEYNLGRRTLLDLLTSQNDVINSREQIIKTEYDKLFAKYRILDAMGILITTIVGSSDDYVSKVNLVSNDEDAKEALDIREIDFDIDDDNISDDLDLCDNSLKNSKVLYSGCKLIVFDTDNDGVTDSLDKCPSTNSNVNVSANGCENDSDNDGVVDSEDECPNTESNKEVAVNGCIINLYDNEEIRYNNIQKDDEFEQFDEELLTIFYKKGNYKVSNISQKNIKKFTDFLISNDNYDVILVGHANKEGNNEEMQLLSKQRAKYIMLEFIKNGVNEIRLSYEGVGDSEPIAFGNTPKELALNRRVEVILVDISSENSDAKIIIDDILENDTDYESYKLDINFKENDFKLSKDSDSQMSKFVNFLNKNPDYNVEVIGHTSNIGKEYENQWISEMRAKYITLDLIKRGIEKSRLRYTGMGDKEPISFGTLEKDIALNSRIEIKLTKK